GKNGAAASANAVAPATISIVLDSGSSATLINAFQLAWHSAASRTAMKTKLVILGAPRFTLPWRGRVGEHRRCEPGWGAVHLHSPHPDRFRVAQAVDPPPPRPGAESASPHSFAAAGALGLARARCS